MRKVIAVIIALVLLLCVSSAVASDDASLYVSMERSILEGFFGEPSEIEVELSNPYDCVNARYIFLRDASLGSDLALLLRFSETKMYLWSLDLTPSNLFTAKRSIFDKFGSLYCIMVYEGDSMTDIAAYSPGLNPDITYDSFMAEVDRIIFSMSYGDMTSGEGADDPVISSFPGIDWAMTRDEVLDRYGSLLYESDYGTGDYLYMSPWIGGKLYLVSLYFNDDKTLNYIHVTIDRMRMDQLLADLSQAYGDPYITTYEGALTWKIQGIKEDTDGDTYAWMTDQSLIVMDDERIQYMPLYAGI